MQNRIVIGLVNLVSLPFAAVAAYLLFIGGIFASDSGSSAAIAVSYGVMFFALAYAIFTVVAIILSQRRRSLWWALVPFIVPIALILFVLSPAFSFS